MLLIPRPGGDYLNISSANTYQVKTGEGVLRRIVVNGGTLTGTIKLIDNTSGSTVNIGTIGANQVAAQNYEYNLNFSVGLRIITSANVDITVVYE